MNHELKSVKAVIAQYFDYNNIHVLNVPLLWWLDLRDGSKVGKYNCSFLFTICIHVYIQKIKEMFKRVVKH